MTLPELLGDDQFVHVDGFSRSILESEEDEQQR